MTKALRLSILSELHHSAVAMAKPNATATTTFNSF